jgi:hypothetical protein
MQGYPVCQGHGGPWTSHKPKCTGTCRDGRPCGKWPIRGGTVCKTHGGSAPQVRAKAAQNLAAQAARKAFGRLVDVSTPVEDPLTELQKLAGDVVAWKTYLAEKIADIKDLSYDSETTGEQIRGDIQLWERALDRCNTVLATCARLDIDARLATIHEKQADAVIAAIEAALDAVKVPSSDRPAAMRAASAHLRLVPA